MTSPLWIKSLKSTCSSCQQEDQHIAFIETDFMDDKTKQMIKKIDDYHFCPTCKKYDQSPTTSNNYDLFHQNTLSKRNPPVPLDPNKGIVNVI